MSWFKKILLGVIVFLIVIGGYFLFIYYRSNQLLKNIMVKDGLFVLGHPSCIYCNMFEPILNRMTGEYAVSYTYVNTDNLVKKDFLKILNMLHTTKDEFGTPAFIVMDKGKVKKYKQGYMDDLEFFSFLKKANLLKEDQEFIEPYPNVTRLTGKTYLETIVRDDLQLLLVGRSGHGRTEQILKKLNDWKLEKYTVSFLNPSNLGTSYPEFIDSLNGYFNQDKIEMPLLLVIQKNKIIKEIDLTDIRKIKEQL